MKLICITCPKGCHLEVIDDKVIGAGCEKGIEYTKEETTNPKRVITSTVEVVGGNQLPVKTKMPVPKGEIFNVMKEISKIKVTTPVNIGDVVLQNVCNTGVDIVATANI